MTAAAVSLRGARTITVDGESRAPLSIADGKIRDSSLARAYRIDLRDHVIAPGLVNAHEHLHLNAVPPLPAGAPFPNSYAWIAAFQAHFRNPFVVAALDRKSTRLNSSHPSISYAVFCLK